ncbi:IclR family transcriptional regulator [Siculibacillus lacustris]|uniref:IclR family transcriptional regulator n=2 Tax=Siculibacillus lacustris TaxID=1549641 RepID=A0A4V2KUG0_9HYPH|nr:IclR family transcriptional regulator [Siculibacillus lacustris]
MRGLALLEFVAEGVTDLRGIVERLGTRRSTTHRMLGTLVAEGYLHHLPYKGYTLGPKLIRLGARAIEQRPIVAIARPRLEALAQETGDTVHLGVADGPEVFYLDKISGTRGLEMRSRIGQRMPLALTGVGKALMFGVAPAAWRGLYDDALDRLARASRAARPIAWDPYRDRLAAALSRGWVYDFEENEIGIRCVAAPIRDVTGGVVAAISVAGAVSHLSEERMTELGPIVRDRAAAISGDLGWTP